jgi:murein DD-endopeptidase MepM/ murein hydrolase activator NlpD/Zn-dependent protease with chaperone function
MLRELHFILLVVGLIPFLWSGALAALRKMTARKGADSMRAEIAILALMIAPVLVGAAAPALAPMVPDAPLPALDFEDIGWAIEPAAAASSETVAAAAAPAETDLDLGPFVSVAIAAIYLAGLGWSADRLFRAKLRLDRAARAGAPAPALGEAVRFTDEALPPFASARGVIVLPSALMAQMPPSELAFVVRHEQAHLDRGDQQSFWMLAWVDALFWFNPFVRRQTGRCRLAAELACDAAVVAEAPQRRGDYARALVAAVKHAAAAPCPAPSIFSTQDTGEHHMRLTRIMTATPAPRSRLARLATLAAGLLLVPVGGLQLVACAGGGTEPTANQTSTPARMGADGLSLEMTSVDGAPVAVERVDETLVRLTGPLRIETAGGEYLTDRAEVQLTPPVQDGAEPTVQRVVALDAKVVSARSGVPDMFTDEPVPLPDQPVQTGITTFGLCEGEVALPELGRLETTCRANAQTPQQAATEVRSATPLTLEFLPVEGGRITNAFGPGLDAMTGQETNHTGVDIAASRYAPVVAPARGRVTFVGWRGGYGRVVELDHGGDVKSRYAHLQLAEVSAGDEVVAGQLIGRVGATGRTTGEHMHWEIWSGGVVYDPEPMMAALEPR